MADAYKVKLMNRALHDLDNIYKYIAETLSEPDTAQKLTEKIEQEILSLEHFPHRCPPRRTGAYANKGYRQLFVKNYTAVFRVDEVEKTVRVITVRYSSSQF